MRPFLPLRTTRHLLLERLHARHLLAASEFALSDFPIEKPFVPFNLPAGLITAEGNSSLFAEGEGPIGDDHELLGHEHIPDFAANPTHRVTASGKWSEIVALQGLDENSVVVIEASSTVIYDRLDVRVKAIGVYGKLQFAMDRSTSLTVQELLVYGSGQLEIGTRINPVPSNITVSIIIGDKPLDAAKDPTTAGNGIIVLGKIGVFGEQLQSTYANLVQSPRAGDMILRLSQIPGGWTVGDTISLPQTMADANQPLSEEFRITAIGANNLQLDRPVGFDRPAAIDGDLTTVTKGFDGQELRGQVANLSRNVRFRSENPNGNRGHFIVLGFADVDIRYAAFESLGRTKSGPLDSTTFDAAGRVTHLGTNQVGRYPLHIHHLKGPHSGIAPDASVDPAGIAARQYRIIGNSITDGKKWGITVHGTSYGLISGNVVHNVDGAGIVNEDGSEAFNYITKNFVFGLKGDGSTGRFDPLGTRGSAFWTRGGHNYWVGNIAAAAQEGFGLYITNDFGNTASGSTVVRIPKFPGADISIPGEYFEDAISNFELLDFSDNQVYAVAQFSVGSWVFSGAGDAPPLFTNTTIWNSTGIGIYADYNSATVEGLIVRGNARHPMDVVFLGHNSGQLIARHFDIQQANKAFRADDRPSSFVLFENGYVRNYDAFTFTSSIQGVDPVQYVFRNVKFDAVVGKPLAAIRTELDPSWIRGGGYVDSINHTIQVLVYGYQGNSNDNFRLYFNEQAADYVIPVRSEGDTRINYINRAPQIFDVGGQEVNVQMPEVFVLGDTPGQSGAQSWETHRVAVLRELAPLNSVHRNGLIGLASPIAGGEIQAIPAALPAPSFWFEKNSQTGHGSTVDIVYKDFVSQGAEAILFRVDNGAWIREVDNDGAFRLIGLSPGIHHITAALAGASSAPWGTRVFFEINVVSPEEIVAFNPINGQSVLTDSGQKTIDIDGILSGRIENGARFSVVATNPGATGQPEINWVPGSTSARLLYKPKTPGEGHFLVTLTNAGTDRFFDTFDDVAVNQYVRIVVADPPFDPNARTFFDELPSTISASSSLGEQSITLTGIESGPGKLSLLSVINGAGLQSIAVDYYHGDKTATIRFTPVPGIKTRVLLDIYLINAGPDRAYFTRDDLRHRQLITLKLSPAPTVTFDEPPRVVASSSSLGEQTIGITGIEAGPGTRSIISLGTVGSGLQAAVVDYKHGNKAATIRYTPTPGVRATVQLEVSLINSGKDNLYGTTDDLTFSRTIKLELSPSVSFDPLPTTISASSSLGEQEFGVTGIQAGPGARSSIILVSKGNGLQSVSANYKQGEKSAKIQYTPIPGVTASVQLEVTLVNAGADGVYSTLDDLKFSQTVTLELRPTEPPSVKFDRLPSTIYASSSLGVQTISIRGLQSGPGTKSDLGLITSGAGILAVAVDYRHGDSQAKVRFTPQPGISTIVFLEIILRNAGTDNVYFSNDDLTHSQRVMIVLQPTSLNGSRSSDGRGLAQLPNTNGDVVVSAMDAVDYDDNSLQRRKRSERN